MGGKPMQRLTIITISAILYVASAVASLAATYNIQGSFSGGQLGTVEFDLTIDADFSADISATTSGLTVNTLTSSLYPAINLETAVGGVGYGFKAATIADPRDILIFGGLNGTDFGGLFGSLGEPDAGTTDIYFQIDNFLTAPTANTPLDSYVGTAGNSGRLMDRSVTVTPVPLPAGFAMLLAAIAGFAGLGRWKARA